MRLTLVANGLENPWALAFLPDGDMLVSERPGRLRIIRGGSLLPGPVPGLPQIRARGQGGLLDLMPHPDFAANRLLYFSYAANFGDGVTTHVARGRFEDDKLTDVEVLFRAEPASSGRVHFGSRLAFDGQGFLYISVGDRGKWSAPRNSMTTPGNSSASMMTAASLRTTPLWDSRARGTKSSVTGIAIPRE